MRPLRQSFYARDAVEVAPDLIGKHLVRGSVVLRITELEAYPPGDSASHCRAGRTRRNEPMWGAPGHAYVYLCYGVHMMLNVVTNAEGEGAAVLIRGCEVVEGHRIVEKRRRRFDGGHLAGPGKVGQALGLDTTSSGDALFDTRDLSLTDGEAPRRIARGRRIGIDFATPAAQRALFRFADADSPAVTHRKLLR